MSRSLLLWIAASVVVLIGLVLWTRAEPRFRLLEAESAAEDAHEDSAPGLSAVVRDLHAGMWRR